MNSTTNTEIKFDPKPLTAEEIMTKMLELCHCTPKLHNLRTLTGIQQEYLKLIHRRIQIQDSIFQSMYQLQLHHNAHLRRYAEKIIALYQIVNKKKTKHEDYTAAPLASTCELCDQLETAIRHQYQHGSRIRQTLIYLEVIIDGIINNGTKIVPREDTSSTDHEHQFKLGRTPQ